MAGTRISSNPLTGWDYGENNEENDPWEWDEEHYKGMEPIVPDTPALSAVPPEPIVPDTPALSAVLPEPIVPDTSALSAISPEPIVPDALALSAMSSESIAPTAAETRAEPDSLTRSGEQTARPAEAQTGGATPPVKKKKKIIIVTGAPRSKPASSDNYIGGYRDRKNAGYHPQLKKDRPQRLSMQREDSRPMKPMPAPTLRKVDHARKDEPLVSETVPTAESSAPVARTATAVTPASSVAEPHTTAAPSSIRQTRIIELSIKCGVNSKKIIAFLDTKGIKATPQSTVNDDIAALVEDHFEAQRATGELAKEPVSETAPQETPTTAESVSLNSSASKAATQEVTLRQETPSMPAPMRSNFSFLKDRFPDLAKNGYLAERNIYDDPTTSLSKIGKIGVNVVNHIYKKERLSGHLNDAQDDKTQYKRLQALEAKGLIPEKRIQELQSLRFNRNGAEHGDLGNPYIVLGVLEYAYDLCEWFMQTYGDRNYEHRDLAIPERGQTIIDSLPDT